MKDDANLRLCQALKFGQDSRTGGISESQNLGRGRHRRGIWARMVLYGRVSEFASWLD
jgi:hypothetical protein